MKLVGHTDNRHNIRNLPVSDNPGSLSDNLNIPQKEKNVAALETSSAAAIPGIIQLINLIVAGYKG